MAQLVRKHGWSASRVVREGLRLLAVSHLGAGRKEIVGLGEFSSGAGDLGSDKRHLRGFGL